jgi:hypothetical protein
LLRNFNLQCYRTFVGPWRRDFHALSDFAVLLCWSAISPPSKRVSPTSTDWWWKSHFPIDFLIVHSLTAGFSLEELRDHLPPCPFRKPIKLMMTKETGWGRRWHGTRNIVLTSWKCLVYKIKKHGRTLSRWSKSIREGISPLGDVRTPRQRSARSLLSLSKMETVPILHK